MATATSEYLLFFRDSSPESYEALSPDERRELLRQWNAWGDDLRAKGKMQGGHSLEPKGRVVSGARGKRVVDGPFAEAKELIGGYFLLTVAGLDEATEIAQRCPHLPYGMVVEVRPIAEACELARSIGLRTMRDEPASA
jgi:hypothetical protein